MCFVALMQYREAEGLSSIKMHVSSCMEGKHSSPILSQCLDLFASLNTPKIDILNSCVFEKKLCFPFLKLLRCDHTSVHESLFCRA